MNRLLLISLVGASFCIGLRTAQGDGDKGAKRDDVAAATEFAKRQRVLARDLRRLEVAVRDIHNVRKTRADGYELSQEEVTLERRGRADLHIFLERYRNDTLENLAVYDRLLGQEAHVDPLRAIFGKSLYEPVEVDWADVDLEQIVDDLVSGYGVKMFVRGSVDGRKTMSLSGEMTLLSILLQIENVFDARLEKVDGELWFTAIRQPK